MKDIERFATIPSMNLTKLQLEAIRIVKSDLEYIKKDWDENIDDDSLRRNSNVLRQLLIDEGGLIFKVLKWLDMDLYVQAPNTPLKTNKLENITFYSAGGGVFKGFHVSSSIMSQIIPTPEERKQSYEFERKNRTVKYRLEDFLLAPSIIANGKIFNRVEVIKFVANKLGGTHFEFDDKNLARMKHLMEAKDSVILANKNAIYYEFLSIGQLLVKSKYTDKLLSKIKQLPY